MKKVYTKQQVVVNRCFEKPWKIFRDKSFIKKSCIWYLYQILDQQNALTSKQFCS